MLTTRNEAWGFSGTVQAHVTDAARAWDCAMETIAQHTDCGQAAVRAFLDSRYGRHFADDVTGFLEGRNALEAAIDEAAAKWMSWRITRSISQRTGIPVGLPYLTGFVIQAALEAETEAETEAQ